MHVFLHPPTSFYQQPLPDMLEPRPITKDEHGKTVFAGEQRDLLQEIARSGLPLLGNPSQDPLLRLILTMEAQYEHGMLPAANAAMPPFRARSFDGALPIASKRRLPSSKGSLIHSPRDSDVLFGRGKFEWEHPGNEHMRALSNQYRQDYEKANRREKTEITAGIVKIMKASGSRFLKRQSLDGGLKIVWVEVNDEVARQKVSHVMRDGKTAKRTTAKQVAREMASKQQQETKNEVNVSNMAATGERISDPLDDEFTLQQCPSEAEDPRVVSPEHMLDVMSAFSLEAIF